MKRISENRIAKILSDLKDGASGLRVALQRECQADPRVALSYLVNVEVDVQRLYYTPSPSKIDGVFAGELIRMHSALYRAGLHDVKPVRDIPSADYNRCGFVYCAGKYANQMIRMTSDNLVEIWRDFGVFPINLQNPAGMARLYGCAPWLFEGVASPFALLYLLRDPSHLLEQHYAAIVALPEKLQRSVEAVMLLHGYSKENSWPYVQIPYREDL